MRAANRAAAGERVVATAARRVVSPPLRAELLGAEAARSLEAGLPSTLVREAAQAHLDVADQHLAQGELRPAARSFAAAMKIAMDRGLHFGHVTSPLADDPGAFVEPLTASRTARALRWPRGRERRGLVGGDATTPTRVLIVTRTNTNFLGEIQELLAADEAFESRLFMSTGDDDLVAEVRTPGAMARELLTGKKGVAERAELVLRPLLDWADVVLVEWCGAHAALFTMVDPRDTRVIVRLHSYETFTPWPHLVDFSRVDDVLFVSEHLRDFAVEAIPALREEHSPQLHVLPLGLQLREFARPKPVDARFTLGLVGWRVVAKDPLWALDVLREVRATDDRYRLLLIGDEFDASATAAAGRYGRELEAALAPLEADGAVVRFGRTDDVPAALAQVGVILSSSVRESFHAGLVEGAASGAVPVVRDWPFFAGRSTSARTLFPADWVADTPQEAAERILRATATDQEWRRAGTEASEHAISTWDWENVKGDYARFLAR